MTVIAFRAPTLADVVGWRPSPELTETERLIAQGYADGWTEDAVAAGLGITAADVRITAVALMQRLDCPTPAALVARLLRAGRIR